MKHPIQPLVIDDKGVLRFNANKIVEFLFDSKRLDLNAIALMDFSDEDQQQIAQLLGYSLSGYGGLSYVDDLAYRDAIELYNETVQQIGRRDNNKLTPP